MAEKVIVSREVAEALKDLFSRNERNYQKDEILQMHYKALIEGVKWLGETWEHLNKLSMSEMAQAMFVGYEVKQTPEEIIKEEYEKLFDYEPIDRACMDSFRFVLDVLDIKIKGVNDFDEPQF